MQGHLDYGPLVAHLPTAILVCDAAGKIIYSNRSAETIFELDSPGDADIRDLLPNEDWRQVFSGSTATIFRAGVRIPVCIRRMEEGYLLSTELTEEACENKRRLAQMREHTSELSVLFDTYIDERIWITDGSGRTTFVSETVADRHGVPQESLIGLFVQDLERERLFYPSVIVEVLRTGRQSVVLQQLKSGTLCVAVGIPFFDNEGSIQKVISITRDCSSQIEIGDALIREEPGCAEAEQARERFTRECITQNPEMQKMISEAKQAARSDSNVLIEGESGVGKSLVAKLVHEASARAAGPFLAVNCAVVTESLFDSELFGYAPGAFTGAERHGKKGLIEAAQGGTLFLDEIDELTLSQQVKLLEVIQSRRIKRVGGTRNIAVDIRIVCATKKRLADLVAASRFRMDLFFRLNVVSLAIPPLRKRREDIPLLVQHLAARVNARYTLRKTFSQAAVEKMSDYDYPGNVRELAHAVEQALVTSPGRRVDVSGLPEKIRQSPGRNDADAVLVHSLMPLETLVAETERQVLRLALEKYRMKEEMAACLKIGKATLWRKLKQHGLLADAPEQCVPPPSPQVGERGEI